MNKDILKGKWNQYKGEAKKKWGEFTDDELDQLNGERDIIVGKIQEKYGKSKEEAEREFDDWSTGLDRRSSI
ncbi:CsbD family protein [Alloiococcus sp. CFN-8]|uniref:CsbD family protein n=1 Tax=Alloiococcus sp. CFN-8 TaxID=3416081 RepID=UPI003CFAEFF9